MKRLLIICLVLMMVAMAIYCYLFYPQQSMPVGVPVSVETPEFEKYRNDCLHPCIRYDEANGIYHMAQSPYYGWNNKVENPIYYTSEAYMQWKNGSLLIGTPEYGFNSDPCILLDGDSVLYVWRECGTPRCDSLGVVCATVGGLVQNGQIDDIKMFVSNTSHDYDIEQCPILLKRNSGRLYYENQLDSVCIYAVWYQYHPKRVSNGLAIWRGSSIIEPDFQLIDTLRMPTIYTVDKMAQLRLFDHILYLPVPRKHDVWHFDLFEYKNKLYMVSVAEKGDNIMLSVSDDYRHFKHIRKPLVNNHYSENYTGYRQYFYKPTAFVKNDSLFVFYTANAKDDPNRNQLYVTKEKIDKVIN